jgi:hypothetical protein
MNTHAIHAEASSDAKEARNLQYLKEKGVNLSIEELSKWNNSNNKKKKKKETNYVEKIMIHRKMPCEPGEYKLEIKWKDYDNSYTWKGMREKIMEVPDSLLVGILWICTGRLYRSLWNVLETNPLHWNINWIGRNKQHQHKHNFK